MPSQPALVETKSKGLQSTDLKINADHRDHGILIHDILPPGELLLFVAYILAKMFEITGKHCHGEKNSLQLGCDNTVTGLERLLKPVHQVYEKEYDLEKLEVLGRIRYFDCFMMKVKKKKKVKKIMFDGKYSMILTAGATIQVTIENE